MRRPLSLSLRLTLLIGIAAAGIFVVFGLIVSHTTEERFEAGNNSELKIISSTVVSALSSADTEDVLVRLKGRFDDILVGHHDASLYITDKDQQLVYTNSEPDLSEIHIAGYAAGRVGTPYRWDDADSSYRVLTQVMNGNPEDEHQYTITVAVPIDSYLQFLADFRRTLWLEVLAGIAIMSFVGWIVARRSHAPLRDIVDRIGKISARKLDDRLLPETMPDELTELAVSFNDMLTRVDDSFHRLSDFSSDIAHELRTPVTNLMTQAQVALTRSRSIDEYRDVLYSNIEEYERMAKTIGDILYMARADHGIEPNEMANVDLTAEITGLIEYYDSWAEERGVSISVAGEACMTGDRGMLRRALSNLLSNAIRHTTCGKTVLIVLRVSSDGRIGIVIENTGTEIPAEHIPQLFNRFHRVRPSKHRDGEGAGLGLAIVKSIVDAHRGTIQVTSADGRTCFKISLPGSRPGTGHSMPPDSQLNA